MSKVLRAVPTALVGALLAAVLLIGYTTQYAEADHQPADKVAIAASTVDRMGPGEKIEVLRETMKVSTPSDLILQLTAECDILTQLTTGGTMGDSSSAFGQVRMWIEIDGTPVSIGSAEDDGKVVFCNRAHEQELTDAENDDDGTDELRDRIQTRQANAFNWLAFNTGSTYDDSATQNGNNILELVVYAELTHGTMTTTDTGDFAEAIVGARTLVVEPTKASNHETADSGVEETTETSTTGKGNGKN